MPLITDRQQVLAIYAEAGQKKWVLPTFNSENLTTTEAILQAVSVFGEARGISDLPIIIGITCRYPDRPQSVFYAHSRHWNLGLRLFMADLKVLCSEESPFADLRVMVHLDHIQWDLDKELLDWDMRQFSSIMYDASTLPVEENISKTALFVEQHADEILIEGACDEVGGGASSVNEINNPGLAEDYFKRTGVDLIVADLGTEHRAAESNLNYNRELARDITEHIGPRLCLHGTSSVAPEHLTGLFDDGIRKVNLWTALERESAQVLFREMLNNASKIIGPQKAQNFFAEKMLGSASERKAGLSADFFTTTYRQRIIFEEMLQIVTEYLTKWYH